MFEPEGIYHIYNRSNGTENLFREEENYAFFLEKLFHYIHPIAEIYAWCLMPNHFHVRIRIRKEEALWEVLSSKSKRGASPDGTGFENLSGLTYPSRKEVINWFGGLAHFKRAHQTIGDIKSVFD